MKQLSIIILLTLLPTAWAAEPDYNREAWGSWEDFDQDCQNTRHELLISQSLVDVTYTADSSCYVATGVWQGPFTGEVYLEAEQVDIDHVIALRYAHEHGGAEWPPLLKKVFANDPENLLIVASGENRSKGWRGPSEYMPPERYCRPHGQRSQTTAGKSGGLGRTSTRTARTPGRAVIFSSIEWKMQEQMPVVHIDAQGSHPPAVRTGHQNSPPGGPAKVR